MASKNGTSKIPAIFLICTLFSARSQVQEVDEGKSRQQKDFHFLPFQDGRNSFERAIEGLDHLSRVTWFQH